MNSVPKKPGSGVTLVFILMALIALMALSVVFLSRISRDAAVPESAVNTALDSNSNHSDAVQTSTSVETSGTDVTAQPLVVPPPPPPPLNTPDNRDLPPEG